MIGTVADIMLRDFLYIESDATVAEAEELLEASRISSLPVVNPDGTAFGLLTQRNLTNFYRRPLNNPRAFHAWEICDARPRFARPTTHLHELLETMLQAPADGVLVVNDSRQLVGLVTSQAFLRQYSSANGARPRRSGGRRT